MVSCQLFQFVTECIITQNKTLEISICEAKPSIFEIILFLSRGCSAIAISSRFGSCKLIVSPLLKTV